MTTIEKIYYDNIIKQTQFAQTLEHLCPKKLYYIDENDKCVELTFDTLLPQFPIGVSDYKIDLNKPLIVMYKRGDESVYMGLVKIGYDDVWYFDIYRQNKKMFKTLDEAFDDKIQEYSLETDHMYSDQMLIENRLSEIKFKMMGLIRLSKNLNK